MAHTAEDITTLLLSTEFGLEMNSWLYSDVRRGFVLKFRQAPDIDLRELERRVNEKIAEGLPVHYYNEEHIKIGDDIQHCTSPRMHLTNTADVQGFHMMPELVYDERAGDYSLVGVVGRDKGWDINDLNARHMF
jgi:hypothetical protein